MLAERGMTAAIAKRPPKKPARPQRRSVLDTREHDGASASPSGGGAPRALKALGPRRVLMIASEAIPFAKTGGLADVLGALPVALGRLGCDVTVAIPRYRGVSEGTHVDSYPIALGGFSSEIGFFEVPLSDYVRVVMIDCPELFDRDGLYGIGNFDYPDNARRFAMLVRAALEFAARGDHPVSIVHAHDWQAALAPVYLKSLYASHPMLGGAASVLTIHNLAYQGLFEADWLPRIDLGWEFFAVEQMEYWGRISFLKGGIVNADMVTTVSPRYAEEIQTPALGFGFDGILRSRRDDLVGILNGIDTTDWDPEEDRHLARPFSADDLSGKAASKKAVLARYQMPVSAATMKRPLVGMISRMVDQKGFDLIAALADRLPELDASFVVLGTGEARYQDLWTRLASAYPDRIGARIGFDEPLAHLIEAGADIFLMPSGFEPCGLNQMYSLRYGTIPVVRAVGGLADTVTGYARGKKGATGFVFEEYSPEALLGALNEALALYPDRRKWRALQRCGMAQDHSWDHSAREYVTMYRRAVQRREQVLGAHG